MKICTYQNVMNQQSNLTHHFLITLPKDKENGIPCRSIEDPAVRPLVVADCEKMLDAEIADKKGLSGIAVKGHLRPSQLTRYD